MWLIAGTAPDSSFLLNTAGIDAEAKLDNDCLALPDGLKFPVARGTIALASAAIMTCHVLGTKAPGLLLAGDCGQGAGSMAAYAWLAEKLSVLHEKYDLKGITFHYFYPDMDGHNRVFAVLENLQPRPTLIADAGYMYAAKMSGYASQYDLFTPDLGELAFLADEKAPHPFYTRGFLLSEDKDVPGLVECAARHGNCPENMLVKGKSDFMARKGKVAAEISWPAVEAMECIGGTGDIVAGIATAYVASGCTPWTGALRAARAARYLAYFCKPDPSCQAAELIAKIPDMFAQYRKEIEEPARE